MADKLKINWTISVQVAGGPKVSESQILSVDAYDVIEVVVEPDAAVEKQVQVQPASEGVQLLLIKSDQYSPGLTYKVNDASGDPVVLDGMQFLSGGAVALLDQSPVTLFVNNQSGKAAKVQVLVGRSFTV